MFFFFFTSESDRIVIHSFIRRFDRVRLAGAQLLDMFSRVVSSEMHGVPCSGNGFASRRLESVDSWFNNLSNFVRPFPVSSEFACIQLLSVFEHFAQYYIAQFERSRLDLLVVVAFDLMLIILDAEQGLVAALFYGVQSVEEHVAVEFNVLRHS